MSGGEMLPADVSDYLPVNWLSSDPAAPYTKHADVSKETRVPPGFEKSMESQAVQEITEKLANFVIETDTDSNIPTDTGKCNTSQS